MRPKYERSSLEDRREFLRDLDDRDDVVQTDFTRDGYRTIYAQFEVGLHKLVQSRADRLGYDIEHLNAGIYRFSYRHTST